jgi:hypothetical protein
VVVSTVKNIVLMYMIDNIVLMLPFAMHIPVFFVVLVPYTSLVIVHMRESPLFRPKTV